NTHSEWVVFCSIIRCGKSKGEVQSFVMEMLITAAFAVVSGVREVLRKEPICNCYNKCVRIKEQCKEERVNKMKRIVMLDLALTLAIILAAYSNEDESEDKDNKEEDR